MDRSLFTYLCFAITFMDRSLFIYLSIAIIIECLLLFKSYFIGFVGRLWIHAAGKIPEQATIKAMEDFYREIYAVNGITDIKFPDNYPTSRLLGA